MASALDQLKKFTTVVADTGDIQGILVDFVFPCAYKSSHIMFIYPRV